MRDGQMQDQIPKWHGLNKINSILTDTLNNMDELYKNYPNIENINPNNTDSYLNELDVIRNKFYNLTIKNPNPIKDVKKNSDSLEPVYISVNRFNFRKSGILKQKILISI